MLREYHCEPSNISGILLKNVQSPVTGEARDRTPLGDRVERGSVESWPGVLQVTQKHIKRWKVGLEAEMGFPMSDAYGLPLNAKSLVGSVMANLCGSHYPLHMAMVEVSSQRVLIDKAFSVPKCVRLARMSHHSHKLLRKIRGTVPKEQRDDLNEIWG